MLNYQILAWNISDHGASVVVSEEVFEKVQNF